MPFNIELAKKIKSGEAEGRIMCNNIEAKIIDFDCYLDGKYCIAALVMSNLKEEVLGLFGQNGDSKGITYNELYIESSEEVITKEQVSNIFDETYYQSCKNHIEQVYLDMAAEYTSLICNSCDWKGADAQKVIALWIKLNMPKTECVNKAAKDNV